MSASAKRNTGMVNDYSGKRIGVDGTWFLTWLRSQIKRDDPYWCLVGPVSPAIELGIARFVDFFKQYKVSLTFVFDGLYTTAQGHAPYAPHRFSGNTRDDFHTHCMQHEMLDEDVTAFVVRMLLKKGIEVMTAPYLAWGQLAYLRQVDYIVQTISSIDGLLFGTVPSVITECWTSEGRLSEQVNIVGRPANPESWPEFFTRTLAKSIDVAKTSVTDVHWLHLAPADQRQAEAIIDQCPVWTQEGKFMPLAKTLHGQSMGSLRDLFYCNLHHDAPMPYYLMLTNVLSPSLLAVVATQNFVDDEPLVRSQQHEATLERIIPLRTQIVFQFVQDLQRSVEWLDSVTQLTWQRWTPLGPMQPVPIHRPPRITLDEWTDLNGSSHNFVSVLEFAQNAKQFPDDFVFDTPLYTEENMASSAVLLKTLDLLGYFTHAAHSMSDHEVSSKSVFADALGGVDQRFADEAVLLIELTRTQSLHDGDLGVMTRVGYPQQTLPGAKFATRLMSLLPLQAKPVPQGVADPNAHANTDLLAFNEIARAFQRNLRYLTEVIASTQILRGSAEYDLEDLHTYATRLPFTHPLSTHAGRVLEFMFSTDYRNTSVSNRTRLVYDRFAYLPNLHTELRTMYDFFFAAVDVLATLMNDEEADPTQRQAVKGWCDQATALVRAAFEGILRQ